MHISITADQITNNRTRNLATIDTAITAPSGHPVVLGVSPLEKQTSAFVVTVYESD